MGGRTAIFGGIWGGRTALFFRTSGRTETLVVARLGGGYLLEASSHLLFPTFEKKICYIKLKANRNFYKLILFKQRTQIISQLLN